jgi:hypothetical protein
MRGAEQPLVRPVSLDGGAGNEHFLFGIDLFNAGYFWEAHAFWEQLWAAERAPEMRRFLRALVQTSAACLKASMGEKAGARKLVDRARLGSFEGFVLGIDARTLARKVRNFIEGEGEPPEVELAS